MLPSKRVRVIEILTNSDKSFLKNHIYKYIKKRKANQRQQTIEKWTTSNGRFNSPYCIGVGYGQSNNEGSCRGSHL